MKSIHDPTRKCRNPACRKPVGPKGHNNGPARRYCSTKCQMQHWARRNPRLTLPKGMTRAQLRKLVQGKAHPQEGG